ncbi:MAG: bifunctional phosphoribosyl-AMP cyclohydrolase/phosphoribosyl-ATP diphosphatase HisIE [Candidatus Cyclobacteriaceae bacterium M3_2C_046]
MNNSNKPIDFSKGLIPAVIQDYKTQKVMMLGYMNEEAYQKTVEQQLVTFYSRSKQRLWTKGETSQNYLKVKDILVDCDGDTLLIKADPAGPVCHTGKDTCFDEVNQNNVLFLNYLQQVIRDRHENPSEDSYTSSLFKKGINKVAQKVGEEAVELVIEAKDQQDELFKNEAADLIFHFLVLLEAKNVDLAQVIKVLEERHK